MTAHTPAPWHAGQRYGRSRTEIVTDDGSRALAVVWTHDPTADHYVDEERAEGMANLRLIAAAPELYEQLAKASALLANVSLQDFRNCAKACDELLAKARGEQAPAQ